MAPTEVADAIANLFFLARIGSALRARSRDVTRQELRNDMKYWLRVLDRSEMDRAGSKGRSQR